MPITPGDDHTEFDLRVTSGDGHFISWKDFFLGYAPRDGEGSGSPLVAADSKSLKPASAYATSADPALPFARIYALRGELDAQARHEMAADTICGYISWRLPKRSLSPAGTCSDRHPLSR